MRYSIVYALTRPDAGEKLSVGIIYIDGENPGLIFSKEKIAVGISLLSDKEGFYLSRILESLKKKMQEERTADEMAATISYLHRYSNNLLGFSPIMQDDVSTREALFRRYVR